MTKTTVFLGGTCNGSTWRNTLVSLLDENSFDCFDPVVEDWNAQSQEIEIQHRNGDDAIVYCITPKMTGVYSIAEVVDDSNKRPKKTFLCLLQDDDGDKFEMKSLKISLREVVKLVTNNGVKCSSTLVDLAKDLAEFRKNSEY